MVTSSSVNFKNSTAQSSTCPNTAFCLSASSKIESRYKNLCQIFWTFANFKLISVSLNPCISPTIHTIFLPKMTNKCKSYGFILYYPLCNIKEREGGWVPEESLSCWEFLLLVFERQSYHSWVHFHMVRRSRPTEQRNKTAKGIQLPSMIISVQSFSNRLSTRGR